MTEGANGDEGASRDHRRRHTREPATSTSLSDDEGEGDEHQDQVGGDTARTASTADRPIANGDGGGGESPTSSTKQNRTSFAPSSFTSASTTALTAASMSATSLGHDQAQVERADRATRAQEAPMMAFLPATTTAAATAGSGGGGGGAVVDAAEDDGRVGTESAAEDPLTTPKQKQLGRMPSTTLLDAPAGGGSPSSESPTRRLATSKTGALDQHQNRRSASISSPDRFALGPVISSSSTSTAANANGTRRLPTTSQQQARAASVSTSASTAPTALSVGRRDYSLGAGIGSTSANINRQASSATTTSSVTAGGSGGGGGSTAAGIGSSSTGGNVAANSGGGFKVSTLTNAGISKERSRRFRAFRSGNERSQNETRLQSYSEDVALSSGSFSAGS